MSFNREEAAKRLTRQQGRILEYIYSRVKTDGMPPTHDEIAREFGLKSAFGVRQHLRLIRDKGYIYLRPGKSRGIRISTVKQGDRDGLVEIPVVGRIAAGRPILADEHVEDRISVSDSLFRRGTLFALRVQGDSMVKVGIRSGDLAVIRQQPAVANGQIAAVLLGNEATLKRYRAEGRYIRLTAENDEIADILVDNRPDVDLGILGLYVGLIRQAR
jgi:repressor LexA